MHPTEEDYDHLILGLEIDTSGHWASWDWEQVSPITGYDHAPQWLRLAGKEAQAAGVRDRIRSIVGDVRCVAEIPDASFDYVLALGGAVSHCGDPAAAVGEMARVLAGRPAPVRRPTQPAGQPARRRPQGDLATLERCAMAIRASWERGC